MAEASTVGRECSPDLIALFFQDIILEYNSYKKLVRRSEPREPAAIPVYAQPLDEDLQPAGESFHAVSRDISYSGIGIFHTHLVENPWVELTFASPYSGEEMCILARIEHCTPCGRYYIVGCRFGLDQPNVT